MNVWVWRSNPRRSMAAPGTMQAATSDGRQATQLMKLGYQEAGIGDRPGTLPMHKFETMSSIAPKRCRWQQHAITPPWQGQKTEVLVKASSCGVFGIHHNAGHCQRGAGVCHLLTGIGQKNRAQAFALKADIHREAPDERHRHRVSRQLLRKRRWQFRATHAAVAQGKPNACSHRKDVASTTLSNAWMRYEVTYELASHDVSWHFSMRG